MARKRRAWFPGAMYHITIRGNRRFPIFITPDDRLAYLHFLEETREQFPFILHSYCLMTNHIHLQLETIHYSQSLIMKNLNAAYAKYFNWKHYFVGHIFQSRYDAELIDTVESEKDISRYIHLNPIEAKLVDKPEDYPWSSYLAYISDEFNYHVTTNKILSYFPQPAELHYQKYVEEDTYIPAPAEYIKPYIKQ